MARRGRRQQGTPDTIMRLRRQIIRDGQPRTCLLCGQLVDVTLPRQHPYSLELDHIRPRRFGGGDEPSNLRVTHKSCNRARGAGNRRINTPKTQDVSANW